MIITTFRVICNWFRTNFNKYHWATVKEAIFGWPWDEGYYFNLTRCKLLEMANYFDRSRIAKGNERTAEILHLLVNLIDIFMERKDLYDIEWENKGDDLFKKDEETGLTKFNPGKRYYTCKVKVNLNNISRFAGDEKEIEIMKEEPHYLYMKKAEKLFWKIMEERVHEFWD